MCGPGVGTPLGRSFFARPSPVVARQLVGCWMVRLQGNRATRVMVTETEAYLGAADPASHAFRGRTARNAPMFGVAGIAYVYFIYGMHYCFNVVTGTSGDPQAVLLRGAVANHDPGMATLRGPGRLCRGLGIDLSCNGMDLCPPHVSTIWFEPAELPLPMVATTARIGVYDPSPLRYLAVGGRFPRPGKEKRAPKGSPII
ncbi:MAG: DNA-3-methyladenine glycosylase [Candidatus Dormibacteria bacterium]